MAILQQNWKEMIKPTSINVEYIGDDKNKAIVEIEPLERGYGITLGNSLRRILLSSIRGFAVTSLKIDGVLHEFSTINGVREDVIDIIMNIKSLILTKDNSLPSKMYLKANTKGEVLASQIRTDGGLQILNPDLVICHIEEDGVNLNIEMNVEYGFGYTLSSDKDKERKDKDVLTIYLDALFNPVKKVSYKVLNARIGQKTDYDKLIMEVETNGTISPEDAIGLAAKIMQDQLQSFINFDAQEISENEEREEKKIDYNINLLKKIDEMELSVRSYNCLYNENILYIADLVEKTELDMLKLPNFGKKSLTELKENLKALGLSFGMDLSEMSEDFKRELALRKSGKK